MPLGNENQGWGGIEQECTFLKIIFKLRSSFFFFFFKVLIEFVTILLLFFVFWFLGSEACGTLAPQPGIKPAPAAFRGEFLTPGLPGKSRNCFYKKLFSKYHLTFKTLYLIA